MKKRNAVAFAMLKIIVYLTCGMLISGTVIADTRIGDWRFHSESDAGEVDRRVASTPAHGISGSDSRPTLVIRRVQPDSPVELMIIDTHDVDKDRCEYREWKLAIDGTDVPILGYTFEPAKTELKVKLGTPRDELWQLFRQGWKLVVEAEQKCDSASGLSAPMSHSFSLRGSSAAYRLVQGRVE